jgi:hypothetical protein
MRFVILICFLICTGLLLCFEIESSDTIKMQLLIDKRAWPSNELGLTRRACKIENLGKNELKLVGGNFC